MGCLQSLDALAVWRATSIAVLFWLAWFFVRTLRPGEVPLIERIARVSDPAMAPSLCRYTRGLTAAWSAYFLGAALLSTAVACSSVALGAWVLAGSAVLFVGERVMRPWFFPGRSFPGLAQQLRDTWSVWRPSKRPAK